MNRSVVLAIAVLALAACRPEKPAPAAPAADPAAEPVAAWGEAVGGLSLRLELDRPSYAAGQRIAVTIRARNGSAEPLRLFDFAHDWVYHVQFDSLDGGPAFFGGSGTFKEYDAPEHVILAPGKEWSRTVGLSEEHRRFLREFPGRMPGDDWDYRPALPSGRWRASIEYGHKGYSWDGFFWTGAVRSNPVDVVVE